MKLVESPRDRLETVTLGLVADRTLPNVLLGAALTASIQLSVGMVGWPLPAVSAACWLLSVVLYAWADEVKAALEERRRRESNPWLLGEDPAPRGIE